MNETKLTTIGQIREFLAGTADIHWTPEADDKARYAFIRNVLSRFNYPRLRRPDKGLIRVKVSVKVSGLAFCLSVGRSPASSNLSGQ